MAIRRKVSIVVGSAQSMIGALAIIFAYTLYYNFLGIQTTLNMPSSDVHLYMLILIIFGMLSIISGLFLVNEE